MRSTCSLRFLIVAFFVSAAVIRPLVALSAAELRPDQPYAAERSEPVSYEIDYSVIVTPPYKTKKLAVWLPIPTSDHGQEISASELSTFPLDVRPQIATEPTFGNRFAYFEFTNPQGAQIIRHQFRAQVWQLEWRIDPSRIESVQQWPKSFDPYRRSESQAVVVDGRFEQLLDKIVPQQQRTNPLSSLGTVMSWVHRNFEYDHDHASLQADATHALANYRGHCSDYHGFCASLGRALGYPTRVTYGINTFPKNSPSHCKLEAYLPPYGWVSFDVSETQQLLKAIETDGKLTEGDKARLIAAAQKRLTSGFRDNTWLLQTRGSDYELVPPASRRVAVVRTIYAEADGQPLPEPDPANKQRREFAWMTAHKFTPDRVVGYAFSDLKTLAAYETSGSRKSGD